MTGLDGPWGLQEIKAPCISRQSAHEGGGKAVSPRQRPSLPPRHTPRRHFCLGISRLQGHSAAGRIKSMKNPSDTIGNRTYHLPACSAVPRPTAPQPLRDNWTKASGSYALLQLWAQFIIRGLKRSWADQSLITRLWAWLLAHEFKIRATQSEPFVDVGVCVNDVSVVYTTAWNTWERLRPAACVSYNWKSNIRPLKLRRRKWIIRSEFWLWQPTGNAPLEDREGDGRIMLKWIIWR
jgi:hypothetical protein